MKPISSLILLLSALPLGAANIASGSMNTNGVSVTYQTRLEPPTPAIANHGGGVLTENNVAKRHLCNFDNYTYFGYDLTMEPLAGGRVRLRFAPLSITPATMARIFHETPAAWTALPRPSGAKAEMEVRPGETVAIDLFVNPGTGQRLTEYLTVAAPEPAVARIEGPARDFRVEDVELRVGAAQISIDGRPGPPSGGGAIAGSALWVDLPGHGRFVFSLVPRPALGLRLAGEIRGRQMSWSEASHRYAVTSDRPVVPGARAYNLYVLAMAREVGELAWFAAARPEEALPPSRGR